MTRHPIKSTEERTILTAMIVHDGVLARIVQNLGEKARPFRSRWTNLVASWCFDHFKKFKNAPRSAIETDFAKFAETSQSEQAVSLVETFLAGLSRDYEAMGKEIRENYVVDLASEYFERVRLETTSKEVESLLARGEVTAAKELFSNYKSGGFGSADWMDPSDLNQVRDSLQGRHSQTIVHWPGDLGKFLNPSFQRDAFKTSSSFSTKQNFPASLPVRFHPRALASFEQLADATFGMQS